MESNTAFMIQRNLHQTRYIAVFIPHHQQILFTNFNQTYVKPEIFSEIFPLKFCCVLKYLEIKSIFLFNKIFSSTKTITGLSSNHESHLLLASAKVHKRK